MKFLSIVSGMSTQQLALVMQIIRYGCVGLGVTSAQAATYWMLATWARVHSQIANFTGYLVAVVLGYFLHSAFTFRGHAPEKAGGSANQHRWRSVRFVAVSLVSWGLNAIWVWIAVSWMGWATWTPIPAMLFVTPALVFVLNRQWVFG